MASANTQQLPKMPCHKIKSGGQPCMKCQNVGWSSECSYVNRDRKIKIHERSIDNVVATKNEDIGRWMHERVKGCR